MKQLVTLIVFMGFLINSNISFSQNYDNVIFSDFNNYAYKIDSIKRNSDLLILSESAYYSDDFDLQSYFLPYSYFTPLQNNLFGFNTNLLGLNLSKSEFFFEGVNLNDNFFGSYDLSNFPRFFVEELSVDKIQNNNYSGAYSLSSSIFSKFTNNNDNRLKLHFHGGDYYGSGALKYNGNYNNYYWNTGVAYKNSVGYKYPQTNNVQKDLKNSQQEKAAIFAKIGIIDNNSDVSFSYLLIDNEKGIPDNIFTAVHNYFLRESQWKSDLFNFKFDTEINNNFNASGNFYYYKSKQIIDNYDDDKFETQKSSSSFRNINDDYKFGVNFIANMNNKFLKRYTLFLNYERILFKNQSNFGLELKKTETERISLGFNKDIVDADNMNISFNSKYHIFNLIFSDFSRNSLENSYFDASVSFTYLNEDELVFNADINYSSKMPEVALLVDSSNFFSDVEQSINSELSVKWLPSSIIQLSAGIFYSNLIDAVYYSYLLFGNNDSEYYDDQIYGITTNCNINFMNYKLLIDYKHLISMNKRYYFSPQNQLNFSLSKSYKFGFEWLIYFQFSSERSFANKYESLPSYSLLNLRFSQTIQNKYEAYLRIDNVLEEYFELYPGTPQPGRIFSAGVKINIGIN